jgi:H+/Na+-translocating ferredoxin:NAD+ oxidoreductase subunit G
MNEITKMVLVTTIICAFSAGWLGALNKGLENRINRQEDYFIRGPAIMELLKGCPNDPFTDRVVIKGDSDDVSIYPWVEEGKVRRVALERSGRGGYGGDVTVMTVVDFESGCIYGVRVTQHKETPGVGTRAMEPSYLNKYVKLDVKKDIKLKKNDGQIDAITGATRSSKAIADSVDRAAKFVLANRDKIIELVLEKKGT